MTSKSLETGDLVWAKMKGYPPWPGKIIVPPPDAKSKLKKNKHCVYFFGSQNHALIASKDIELHNEKMLEKYGQRKGKVFRKAVESLLDYSKYDSKLHAPRKMIENASKAGENIEKLNKVEFLRKNGSLPNNIAPQEVKKKFPKKFETSLKKNPARKRAHSPDPLEGCSRSFENVDVDAHSSVTEDDMAPLRKASDIRFLDEADLIKINKLLKGILRRIEFLLVHMLTSRFISRPSQMC